MPKTRVSPQQMAALADRACNSHDPRVADAAAVAILASPPMSMRDVTAILRTASVALEWLQLGGLSEAQQMAWCCRIRQGLDASLPVLNGEQKQAFGC